MQSGAAVDRDGTQVLAWPTQGECFAGHRARWGQNQDPV